MNHFLLPIGLLMLVISSCELKEPDPRTMNFPKVREVVENMPDQENFWIFIMAGQSNMAGRGLVEAMDTITNERILSIDKNDRWIFAKEPLHWYEPNLTGLDCGMSFANTLLNEIPENITVGILPCAVGGSSVQQWLGDSIYREVQLFSNFKEKVDLAKNAGIIKGIIWHQGERNANPQGISLHRERLTQLFTAFRSYIQNDSLPIVIGPLGSYTEPAERQVLWDSINSILATVAQNDPTIGIIHTDDLTEKGDKVHFDSKSQRMMGARFAQEMLATFKHHTTQ